MSRHGLKAILLSKIGENMKQYFTGFITAMVFTSSLFLFIGAKKRTIDNLTVQKITIVDGFSKMSIRFRISVKIY